MTDDREPVPAVSFPLPRGYVAAVANRDGLSVTTYLWDGEIEVFATTNIDT